MATKTVVTTNKPTIPSVNQPVKQYTDMTNVKVNNPTGKALSNAPTTGYNGAKSNAMYRVEVGGKVVDTKNTALLQSLLSQGGKITMTPGSVQAKEQAPTFDQEAYLKQFQDQINAMYNQQREAELARLRAARDKAIGEINQQKAQTAPMYQAKRNQADVVNAQNVQRLRELMATNGLNASGENVTASVGLQNARQNSLNSLNLQEQQTMDDYNRRITDLMNPSDENALISQLEAERARALLEMGMKADEIGYSRSRDSEMDKRYYDERDYSRGQDQKEWDYRTERDAVEDKRWQEEFAYQKARDQIADERYKAEFEEDKRRWGLEYALNKQVQLGNLSIAQAELALAQARAARMGGGGGGSRGGGSRGGYSISGGSSSNQSSLSKAYQDFKKEKSSSSQTPLDKYYQSQQLKSPKNYLQDIFQPVAPRDNKNLSPWELMKMIGG